jgi:hypothetical protein
MIVQVREFLAWHQVKGRSIRKGAQATQVEKQQVCMMMAWRFTTGAAVL